MRQAEIEIFGDLTTAVFVGTRPILTKQSKGKLSNTSAFSQCQ